MARRSAGGTKVLPVLLLLGVWAGVVGLRASFVVFFVVLVVAFLVVGRARPKGTATSGTDRTGPGLDEAVARLGRLAGELVVPGGRSRDEVAREAAEVYASLPADVRAELDRRAAASGPGTQVTVSGPLGPALAHLLGVDADPADRVPPAAPAPSHAATPAPTPVVQEATTPAPVVAEPAGTVPGGDVRYSVLAPDELTGDPTTPPGAVTEGWYITADRTRERWHNGSSWTAHVRVRGR